MAHAFQENRTQVAVTERIGFIGLGIMGRGMAANILLVPASPSRSGTARSDVPVALAAAGARVCRQSGPSGRR